MKSTQYLYGLDPKDIAELPHLKALKLKRTSGKNLYIELYKSGEDDERRFYVEKALRHTEVLIKEIEE